MKRNDRFSKVIRMGKMVLPLYLFTFLPLTLTAQDDDMYFVPTKENIAKEAENYGMPQNTYYSGSSRSVDDYNRRAQFGYPADSTASDIIDFSPVQGVYPDSAYSASAGDDDYRLTRRMSRFDDYTPSEAYWEGYRAGRWASPWYSSWYSWYDYDPWYWNSPYYYGYYGAYSPWYYGYYGYYGYYRPWYYTSWHSPRYYGWYAGGRGVGSRSYSRAGVTHHKRTSSQRGTSLGSYPASSSRSIGSYRSSSSSSGSSFGSSSSRSSGSFGSSSRGSSGGGGRSVGGGHSFGGRR